jgi:16S rRNA G966 N2-methylase RsmD
MQDMKAEIAKQVRPIAREDAMVDLFKLRSSSTFKPMSNAGLRFVDYHTCAQRLAVRGKMGYNFYDFFANWNDMKERKYINNLLRFYKNDESPKTIYKIYNLACNCIHAFRPVVALGIYERFAPSHVLDPCAGWGGRAVAASVYGAAYTGYDCNAELKQAYADMSDILGENIKLIIGDSLVVEFDKMKKYDMVMTSPPYYGLECYDHAAATYEDDDEWDAKFYYPLFKRVAEALQPGGWMVLSINQKLYDRVFYPLFGEPAVRIPLAAHRRATAYAEWVYAWRK